MLAAWWMGSETSEIPVMNQPSPFVIPALYCTRLGINQPAKFRKCAALVQKHEMNTPSRLFPLLFPIQRFILGVLVNLTEVFHLWEIITGLCRSLVHGSLSHFSFCLFSTTRALLSSDFISPVRGVRFLPEKNTKGGFIHMDINFTLRYETGAKIGWL